MLDMVQVLISQLSIFIKKLIFQLSKLIEKKILEELLILKITVDGYIGLN